MKTILLIVFLFSSGCSEFVTYTIVSAGTLTGRIAHDAYRDYVDVEKPTNEKETKENGLLNQASKWNTFPRQLSFSYNF